QVVLVLRVRALQTVTIAATSTNAGEPSVHGTLTVTRTGSTTSALTVSYTVGGTAVPGTDYKALPGAVTIPKGDDSATVDVAPIDDTTVETPESVIVTLGAKAGYALGLPKRATVTIADDDGVSSATTVTVVATDPIAAEPSDPGTFTITRTGSTAVSLVVLYSASGTATAG